MKILLTSQKEWVAINAKMMKQVRVKLSVRRKKSEEETRADDLKPTLCPLSEQRAWLKRYFNIKALRWTFFRLPFFLFVLDTSVRCHYIKREISKLLTQALLHNSIHSTSWEDQPSWTMTSLALFAGIRTTWQQKLINLSGAWPWNKTQAGKNILRLSKKLTISWFRYTVVYPK